MNKLLFIISATVLALGFSAFTLIQEVSSWEIADDYVVSFDGRGASGSFSSLDGTIKFDPENPEASSMDVFLKANSIDTGSKGKNKHVNNDSWLDTEKYTTIRFRSKEIVRVAADYEVKGELTLHGVTREVKIPFSYRPVADGGMFKGSFTINRKDYDIKGPLLGFAVGNEFEINLRVPVK